MHLKDRSEPGPDYEAYMRGFVQALLVAELCGFRYVVSLIARLEDISEAEVATLGLSMDDVAHWQGCAGQPLPPELQSLLDERSHG